MKQSISFSFISFPVERHNNQNLGGNTTMKGAVIYARYSCERQTEQSIEGQLRECYKYAEQNGLTIIHEYIDRAMGHSSGICVGSVRQKLNRDCIEQAKTHKKRKDAYIRNATNVHQYRRFAKFGRNTTRKYVYRTCGILFGGIISEDKART